MIAYNNIIDSVNSCDYNWESVRYNYSKVIKEIENATDLSIEYFDILDIGSGPFEPFIDFENKSLTSIDINANKYKKLLWKNRILNGDVYKHSGIYTLITLIDTLEWFDINTIMTKCEEFMSDKSYLVIHDNLDYLENMTNIKNYITIYRAFYDDIKKFTIILKLKG